MKPKEVKYQEAVERNIKNSLTKKVDAITVETVKAGSLDDLVNVYARQLGVRKDDSAVYARIRERVEPVWRKLVAQKAAK